MRTLLGTWLLLSVFCLPNFAKDNVYIGKSFEVRADQSLDELVVIGSTGTIAGQVKEFYAIGSTVTLRPTAKISQEFVSIGSTIEEQPGSDISAKRTHVAFPFKDDFWKKEHWEDWEPSRFFGFQWRLAWALLTLMLSIGLGTLFYFVFPQTAEGSVTHLQNRLPACFGYGALAYLLAAPVGLLLLVSLVGIPLLPLYIMLAILLCFAGQFVAALYLGRKLPVPQKSPFASLYLGLAALAFVQLIPFLGGFLSFLASIAGLGGLIAYGLWYREKFQKKGLSAPE